MKTENLTAAYSPKKQTYNDPKYMDRANLS